MMHLIPLRLLVPRETCAEQNGHDVVLGEQQGQDEEGVHLEVQQ